MVNVLALADGDVVGKRMEGNTGNEKVRCLQRTIFFVLWSMRDSNSPPLDCQSNALAR